MTTPPLVIHEASTRIRKLTRSLCRYASVLMFPFDLRGRYLSTLTCPLSLHSHGLLNLSFRLITRSILPSWLRSSQSNVLLSLSRCLSFWDAFFTIDLGDTIHCGEGSIL